MIGKVVVTGISLILVVGVVIGVVAGIHRNGSSKNGNGNMPSLMKEVASICAPTDFKQACMDSLSGVAKNTSATPKDLIMAAIDATIQEVKSSFNVSSSLLAGTTNDTMLKMAFEDCNDLLKSAIDELHLSHSIVGESALQDLNARVGDLNNWLSAVTFYQQACLEGINDPKLQTAMKNGLLKATQLTSNALAIVTEISTILGAMGVKLQMPNSRRLLGVDGYPTWFSAADRKLLAFQDNGRLKPDAVVAKDGSGQYKTIGAALASYPTNYQGRYVIYIKAGIYDEYVTVTQDKQNIFFYGDGPRKTIITGNKNYRDGVTIERSAPFITIANGTICKSMGFQNTAGPAGHQAVALRVKSDKAAFINCRIDGYQDTLYAQVHLQFYRNCVISGSIDFIFGDATAVIQNSLIIVRRPMDNQKNAVTAHGRISANERTGFVIQNCRIVPEEKLFPDRFKIPTYLGRPWKQYSRTVIMESTLGDFIQPEGWMPWAGNFALDTLFYAEYANRGPGARTDKRVSWKGYKVITDRNEALKFTAGPFIDGNVWLKNTGAPFLLRFKND